MGFEHWEVGFRKKMGWEMGLVPPLQDPLNTVPNYSGSGKISFCLNLTIEVACFRLQDSNAEQWCCEK